MSPVVDATIGRRATLFGGATLLAIATFMAAMGAYTPPEAPEALPVISRSAREVFGMALMLTFVPSWFVAAAVVTFTRSRALMDELAGEVDSADAMTTARERIDTAWKRAWLPGLAFGAFLAMFNTSVVEPFTATQGRTLHFALNIGQITMWLVIGTVICGRLMCAEAFRKIGDVVRIDLYALDRLKPLARSGLADALVIAGALTFTPLQSLDAEFRWYNYHFALLASTTGVLLLVFWPLRTIRARVAEARRARLSELDTMIAETGAPATAVETTQFEALCAHRDRIAAVRTWLLSTDLISRIGLTLVIPPLAWIGAALAEQLVERLLEG